jgi:hypothetical protein
MCFFSRKVTKLGEIFFNDQRVNYCTPKSFINAYLFLTAAKDCTCATSADQIQSAHPLHLTLVCTVCYSVSTYFEISPKMMNGLSHIERWTSSF